MNNLFALYARYDGPLPRNAAPLRYDVFIGQTLEIIRDKRRDGLSPTLDDYVFKLTRLVRLEKKRKTGQNS